MTREYLISNHSGSKKNKIEWQKNTRIKIRLMRVHSGYKYCLIRTLRLENVEYLWNIYKNKDDFLEANEKMSFVDFWMSLLFLLLSISTYYGERMETMTRTTNDDNNASLWYIFVVYWLPWAFSSTSFSFFVFIVFVVVVRCLELGILKVFNFITLKKMWSVYISEVLTGRW